MEGAVLAILWFLSLDICFNKMYTVCNFLKNFAYTAKISMRLTNTRKKDKI